MYFCYMKIDTKKKLAQSLYVRLGKTQKEIADSVSVTEKTIGRWKEKYKWDVLRAAEVSTPEELAKSLYASIFKITDAAKEEQRPLTAAETDQISKISKSIANIKQKPTLSVVSSIMEDFANWLKNRDLNDAQILIKHQMSYLEDRAK